MFTTAGQSFQISRNCSGYTVECSGTVFERKVRPKFLRVLWFRF